MTTALAAILLLARPAAAAPTPNQKALSSYAFDAAKPLDERVAKIPAWLLDAWRKADDAPAYAAYEPTKAERRAFAAALDGLPPRMKDALRERVIAFYFVKNLKGNGVTDLVLDASSRTYCYTIFNPAAFKKTVSQVLTERERSAFRGSADVSVEAGDDDGILYTVSHEMTHAFDYARRLTPYTDPGEARALGWPLDASFDAWQAYAKPLPAGDFPLRGKLAFYGFGGPNLDAAQAPEACAQLAGSPFASLYGSRAWAEDAAELFVARHLVVDLGRPYKLTCGGKTYEPMGNPRVAVRAGAVLAPIYGPLAQR